ncbi:MAG: type secretion system secreted protein Hcp [Actinomycetota bacterium]|jgi:type VI secretion system secreted protein Hcp|nr:type secretion system secreted protein Hcp [Actinomycetota bacterium]MEA2486598.1 type secretion system secreted protein Hcp [Actinomycetota bacterium]
MAHADYFLKIDGVDGESVDKSHPNEIQIESWSWGETNSGSTHSGSGLGVGKVSMQDFHFSKVLDKSTPLLMLACASGQHIKKATLTARKQNNDAGFEFLHVQFTEILISSYADKTPPIEGTDANGQPVPSENEPVESLSFNFAKIQWSYSYQNADGTASTVSFGWDLKKNQKF